MKIIILSLILGLTLLFADSCYSLDKAHLNAIGIQELKQEAPDFTIKGPDGNMMSLKDFMGKVVILHFWGTWCKPCKEEFPLFEKMYQRVKDKDVFFIPVSIDAKATQEDINAFAKRLGATFPVFLARDGNVTDRYWTWGVPVTYFVDKKGLIAGRAIGPRDWASDGVNAVINALLEEK
ncbi:MAG: TlpA family protein disulfide reductase [Deltaproteobacteria bacterium]|nr:TlpA family protein disulfide reductase [Deltaproteobacteria bacterium]